jgi:hypothetical protein
MIGTIIPHAGKRQLLGKAHKSDNIFYNIFPEISHSELMFAPYTETMQTLANGTHKKVSL